MSSGTRAVAPHMRKLGGGRIINISTVGAHTPPPFVPDYDAAKAAMLTFSKATSFELAPDNILVNMRASFRVWRTSLISFADRRRKEEWVI
jgi:NAD(P)-dependent dehydrogenase (short-subunit alcohol dehydrogenase family)